VTAQAAYQEVLFGRATLVDIRPQGQREQEGEVHPDLAPVVIERNVLEWRLDPRHPSSLPIADHGLRVILICQESYTSSLAADVLLRLGIHRATDIIGGFAAWRGAGLPCLEPVPEPGPQRGARAARAPGTGNSWRRRLEAASKSCSGGADSTTLPPSMKWTVSATPRANPISWVTTSIVMPSPARCSQLPFAAKVAGSGALSPHRRDLRLVSQLNRRISRVTDHHVVAR